jgi:hypothetical protein
MLSLLYITILAVPLTLLALAFLLIVVRGAGRRVHERSERRKATPLAPPPSTSRLREARLDLRRSLARALDPETAVEARVVASPRERATPLLAEHQRPMTAAWAEASVPTQAPPAGLPTKACPECAETVLAAARICKHCRYRFDGEPARVYDWSDTAASSG